MTLLDRVATRWYRAPEGLVSSEHYTEAVDVWSVGCILAELLSGEPLFRGRTDEEQLEKILMVLGTPSEPWIGSENEEIRQQILALPHQPGESLVLHFPEADPDAIDLLEKLLAFDPARRLTVIEALAHPYLAEWHDESDEPICPAPFVANLPQDTTLPEREWRELMWGEIMAFHSSGSEQKTGQSPSHLLLEPDSEEIRKAV